LHAIDPPAIAFCQDNPAHPQASLHSMHCCYMQQWATCIGHFTATAPAWWWLSHHRPNCAYTTTCRVGHDGEFPNDPMLPYTSHTPTHSLICAASTALQSLPQLPCSQASTHILPAQTTTPACWLYNPNWIQCQQHNPSHAQHMLHQYHVLRPVKISCLHKPSASTHWLLHP
jgi:hypothetical protein